MMKIRKAQQGTRKEHSVQRDCHCERKRFFHRHSNLSLYIGYFMRSRADCDCFILRLFSFLSLDIKVLPHAVAERTGHGVCGCLDEALRLCLIPERA